MPIPFLRRSTLTLWVAAALALWASPRLAAELTYVPGKGWQLEGGSLSGLAGPQGRAALELMNKARKAEDQGSLRTAIKDYEKVSKKYQASVYAPEALFRAGDLLFHKKQYYRAFTDFALLVQRYPNSKRFNSVIGKQYQVAAALMDGAHNRIWGWFPGPSNRIKAIEYFMGIVAEAPYSDYAALSLMDAARGFQMDKDTDEAIDSLDRLVNTYPQSVLAPVAYLKLGDLHASLSEGPKYDQASTKEAMTYYEDFMILYPGDPNIAQAAAGVDKMKTILAQSKIYIGDYYFYKRLNFTAAKVFYNEAITAFPDSAPANVAKKRLAELAAKAAKEDIRPKTAPKKRFWLF
jgi:outer membrane protein assembly factor BamD